DIGDNRDRGNDHAVEEVARERNVVPDVDIVEGMRRLGDNARRIGKDVLAGDAGLQYPIEGDQHDDAGADKRQMDRPAAIAVHQSSRIAPASRPDRRLAAQVTDMSRTKKNTVTAAA